MEDGKCRVEKLGVTKKCCGKELLMRYQRVFAEFLALNDTVYTFNLEGKMIQVVTADSMR